MGRSNYEMYTKLNREVGSKFYLKRGLRQGSLISPYLFILVAKALSSLLSRALGNREISSINLSNCASSFPDLFFVKDSILFSKASRSDAYKLTQISNTYTSASS